MTLNIQLFSATSGVTEHPYVKIVLPKIYKILGGGAKTTYTGAGSILTSAYPENPYTWIASAKDHEVPSPASITAYALALYDPNNEWLVDIQPSPQGNASSRPVATAVVRDGYILTGGGAQIKTSGPGILLVSSFPSDDRSWRARGKDHLVPDSGRIIAYAIGLKHASGDISIERKPFDNPGDSSEHPVAHVNVDPGWTLSGGGASDSSAGEGNLLTAIVPGNQTYDASGKDHVKIATATIHVYAIGIRQVI